MEYIKNGEEIYRKSFAIIRAETNWENLPDDLAHVAVRAAILCDSQMVANGITKARLPKNNPIICTLNHPEVTELARQINNTRSAAALELWRPRLAGAVVAIGNAPTALFRLLELLDQNVDKPALILGFPVGFVGAAESKLELATNSRGVPFITLHGRRGGSAIAAAAVNALAKENEL
jgi:precorrin-8X/cobalt-precorrin-8 methylmutase